MQRKAGKIYYWWVLFIPHWPHSPWNPVVLTGNVHRLAKCPAGPRLFRTGIHFSTVQEKPHCLRAHVWWRFVDSKNLWPILPSLFLQYCYLILPSPRKSLCRCSKIYLSHFQSPAAEVPNAMAGMSCSVPAKGVPLEYKLCVVLFCPAARPW